MSNRSWSALGLVLVLAISTAGCQAIGPEATVAPTPVVVLLDWFPNTNHTGLYVALDKGWYAEQGLDVQIIEPAEGSTLVQVVAAGQADFGISYQEEVSYARAEDLPILSLAAILQHT